MEVRDRIFGVAQKVQFIRINKCLKLHENDIRHIGRINRCRICRYIIIDRVNSFFCIIGRFAHTGVYHTGRKTVYKTIVFISLRQVSKVSGKDIGMDRCLCDKRNTCYAQNK